MFRGSDLDDSFRVGCIVGMVLLCIAPFGVWKVIECAYWLWCHVRIVSN